MSQVGGIGYRGITTRGVSEAILQGLSFEKGASYGRGGYTVFHDMLNTAGLTLYTETGCTIRQRAEKGGVLRISMDGTANDESSIAFGDNYGSPFYFNTSSDTCKLAFEARIRTSTVADNGLAWIAGLAEEGLAAAATLTDSTGEIASKDFVGFQTLCADGDAVNVIHRKASQNKATLISGVQASAASTWYKLGFKYDPTWPDDKKLRFYVNGTEQTTYGTTTTLGLATFPTGEQLTPLIAVMVGSAAAAATFDVDYIFCHQEQVE